MSRFGAPLTDNPRSMQHIVPPDTAVRSASRRAHRGHAVRVASVSPLARVPPNQRPDVHKVVRNIQHPGYFRQAAVRCWSRYNGWTFLGDEERAPRHPARHRSVGMAVCYTMLHATLYFTRLVTLTVAVNSSNNVLLTILISNNFVELKSSVFKRFAPANLLQICCSDIVERFVLFSVLLLTGMQTQNWDQFLRNSAYMVCVELIVDWVKHSFITKFNQHPPELYEDYMDILSRDIAFSTFVDLLSEHRGSPSRLTPTNKAPAPFVASRPLVDPTQAVARRVGLACIPISCVILRFLWVDLSVLVSSFSAEGLAIVVLSFLCLVALKTLLNVLLLVRACSHLIQCARDEDDTTPREQRLGELASIQRYTLFKSRIPTH